MRSLSNEIDRGDEVFEEIKHVDGKVSFQLMSSLTSNHPSTPTQHSLSLVFQTFILYFFSFSSLSNFSSSNPLVNEAFSY